MRLLVVIIVAIFVSAYKTGNKIEYPMTKKVDTVDIYFGHSVPDPYRWLEDDMSSETAEWVKAQNKVTDNYLEQIPFRNNIKQRLTDIWNYPKISAPVKKGGRWFVMKNDGLQSQSVLYLKNNINHEGQVLLDPNKLSSDGTVALTLFQVSNCGKYLAYSVAGGGSDWNEIFVKNIETGQMLDDHIKWVKFSDISWCGKGFYYSSYPQPDKADELKGENKHCKIYYHKLGTQQATDEMIFQDIEHPERGFYVMLSSDNNYMVIAGTETTSGNCIYIKDLKNNTPIVNIVPAFTHDYELIDYVDGKLYFLTNYDAPKYKLVALDVNDAKKPKWEDIIQESEGVLKSVNYVGDKLIANYIEHAHSKVKVYSKYGEFESEINIPVMGTVSGFSGKPTDEFTFYTITSFTTPSLVYKYDIKNNESVFFQKSELDFNDSDYETKQVFYESKDSTKVPMFIVYKKGLKLDGSNPVLLYGYGGFNVSLTPSFSLTRLLWLEQGGIYAVMNLRGGGEYGEQWHKAGTKMNKQNVFDDCIAAAEYLINEKYTSEKKIALMGGSNGGLLVGAVINQRPELFGAAFPLVGVMDMLRYHKFTIGRYWAADYGTSEDSEEMFKYLYKYSPVHSICDSVDYPPVLVTTADHDDRVVPAHSFKYIATLQEKYKGSNPVLIRIETNAGHGAGKPTEKVIEEYTDMFAFMMYNMGITPKY